MSYQLKIINDPVYGFIKIPHKILFDVIEHPYFQRLRRISQTALLYLVYPGAVHTRFHHALGAMHLMFTALETLRLKGVSISLEEEKAALLAILMHDIGHGPYSHALESVLMNDCQHEKLSLLLMNELNQEFGGQLSMAIQMFQGEYSRPFFSQLISSQLDVDRMDYLKRDSFYTGVSEGNINTQRIISLLNVNENHLVVDAKGTNSVENFLTARMFMHWQVYFHKTSVGAERLLIKALSRAKELSAQGVHLEATPNLNHFLKKNKFDKMTAEDLHRFTQLDDSDVMFSLKSWENHSDFILKYLCQSIMKRNFPKSIISIQKFGEGKVAELTQLVNEFYHINNGEWLVDEIEKTLLPYNVEQQPILLQNSSGIIFRLEQSESRLITEQISVPSTKYILSFPRDILPHLEYPIKI